MLPAFDRIGLWEAVTPARAFSRLGIWSPFDITRSVVATCNLLNSLFLN